MKALTTLLLAVSLGLATTAAADTPKQEMSDAEVTTWLAFFDKLVTTVVKAQSCDKLASDVSSVIDQNRAAIDIARNARDAGKKLPEAAQQRMLTGVKKMVPAMQRCGQHERVKAAFSKLDLNRKS